ncbi:MAG: hypothetical protein AAGK71_08310, partial [Pseudomonadota bacterium]
EDFTEVRFDSAQPEGALIPARITGQDTGVLTAKPLHLFKNTQIPPEASAPNARQARATETGR